MLTLSIYRRNVAIRQRAVGAPLPIQKKITAPEGAALQSVVAVDALAALVAFLGFQAERGDRAGVEAGDADRLAGPFAVAVGAVLDPAQRFVDLGDQLALPVAGAQFQSPISLRRRTVGQIRMI